jgi:ABC-2 type transport system ATP-binding protein
MLRLDVDGLTRRYGSVVALDDLSFSVSSGQVVGLLGPNGAGKTTTMRAIFGLTALDAGSVRWNGSVIRQAQRDRFGYMPEERGFYPEMTAGQHLEYLGQLHGMSRPAARAAATRWQDRLGIADHARVRVESLSPGNQQRVHLAAALIHDPDLLLLDEPLSGLEPAGIRAVGEVLIEQAWSGRCVLISAHQPELAEGLCQSAVIINHGRLVAAGAVADLTSRERPRLVVRVAGDRFGAWATALRGVTVSDNDSGALRLILDPDVDTDVVLKAAMAAGRVMEFSIERPRLSDVVRKALT